MEAEKPYFGEIYRIGEHCVQGVLAELISYIFEDPQKMKQVFGELAPQEVIRVFDTRTPSEERAPIVHDIIMKIVFDTKIAQWIPMHSSLLKHEYAKSFHAGYRDHTIHTLQVYLLGWYLYFTNSTLRIPLSARLTSVAPISQSGTMDLFREWWIITAFWHDQGYLFETSEFFGDMQTRDAILKEISDELGCTPFLIPLGKMAKHKISSEEVRELYRAGHYYPWSLATTAKLLNDPRAKKTIDNMWLRLGLVPIGDTSPVSAINNLTTQDSLNRSPYYDHGTYAALLVAAWVEEVKNFTEELYNSVSSKKTLENHVIEEAEALEAAIVFADMGCVVDLALEAIGFHSLNFQQWPDNVLREHFSSISSQVAIDDEPHLCFLAIVDTLQEWDRHHYLPHEERLYSPCTRSDRFMIQGDEESIKVSVSRINGIEIPAHERVIKNLSKLINTHCLTRLFQGSPSYSMPGIIFSTEAPTIAVVQAQQSRLAELRDRIKQKVIQIKDDLLTHTSEAFVRACASIEHALRTVQDFRGLCTSDDYETYLNGAEFGELIALQKNLCGWLGIGANVSRGKIVGRLTPGGFGSVYIVETENKHQIAYKVMHQADLDNIEKRRLFHRGWEAMKLLRDHPNVVKVYEYTEAPVGFYMDYIPGSDLSQAELGDIFNRLDLALSIAETLSYAHGRDIKHRDIKPANILLNPTNALSPIITDFDLAWIPDRSADTKIIYATAKYGAPEQFDTRLTPFRRKTCVDVYSFGRMLYFLLLDEEPPGINHFDESHFKNLRRRLTGLLMQEVLENLIRLIQDCTISNPENRNLTMSKISKKLRSFRSSRRDEKKKLTRSEYVKEVVAILGGGFSSSDSFNSITGHSSWKLLWNEGGLFIEGRLLIAPCHEGVNFEGYAQNVIRHVDRAIGERLTFWKEFGLSENPRRKRLGMGRINNLEIQVGAIETTVGSAEFLVGFIQHLIRIIE